MFKVVKRGHKKGLVAKHSCCAGPTWYVMLEEDEMTKSLGNHTRNSLPPLKVNKKMKNMPSSRFKGMQ